MQWYAGERHGSGTSVLESSGETYTGMWKHGLWDGQGTFTWSDRNEITGSYQGQWKAGVKHGTGRCPSVPLSTVCRWDEGCGFEEQSSTLNLFIHEAKLATVVSLPELTVDFSFLK